MKSEIASLRTQHISETVNKRLSEFQSFSDKPTEEWFSELCFCILTANSRADSAIAIQSELRAKGFCEYTANDVKKCIMKHKHRFHNNKTRFIMDARRHLDIKSTITRLVEKSGSKAAREWLVANIKGIAYKEASHFLRCVGYTDVVILDRHILRLLNDHNYVLAIPKTLGKKTYLEIEAIVEKIAKSLNMSAAELDLYMWYMKTGKVLK